MATFCIRNANASTNPCLEIVIAKRRRDPQACISDNAEWKLVEARQAMSRPSDCSRVHEQFHSILELRRAPPPARNPPGIPPLPVAVRPRKCEARTGNNTCSIQREERHRGLRVHTGGKGRCSFSLWFGCVLSTPSAPHTLPTPTTFQCSQHYSVLGSQQRQNAEQTW